MMADLEFHVELWERTGDELLKSFLARLVFPIFAFETRNVISQLSREARLHHVEEHRRVIDSLRAGDIPRARRDLERMIDRFGGQAGDVSANASPAADLVGALL